MHTDTIIKNVNVNTRKIKNYQGTVDLRRIGRFYFDSAL
jgi:hypothetical protein